MRYAQSSSVEVERSKADIEFVLKKYGAQKFFYGTKNSQSIIAFELNDRKIRMDVPMPDKKEDRFWHTPMRGDRRSGKGAYKAFLQGERAIWRQIYLLIKAKLEAIENNVKGFDEAFLADIVMPNGKTVKEVAVPQLQAAYKESKKLLGERAPNDH